MMKGTVQGCWMNRLTRGSQYNRPKKRGQNVCTHAQIKVSHFFSGCYSSQLHGVRRGRVMVCSLVLRVFLRGREDPQEEPGSSTDHHVAWVSAEVHHQEPSQHHRRKKGSGAVMKTWCTTQQWW